MAEAIVQDWLSEYSSLQSSEIEAFASMHENNQEVIEALYTVLNERFKYPDLVHSVCNQFYSFYRSNEESLKRFTMQFIPTLIYIYLNSVAMGDKKNCRSVETLLISIYNVEVSTEDGYPKIVSFRMPILAQASIYHEEKSLHAVDLRRWEENSNRDVKWGPMPQIESINAQNRMNVMTALLFSYNQQLCLIQKSALFHLCKISSQLVNQGFSKPGHAHRSSYGNDPSTVTSSVAPKPLSRILLSSSFLVELVHAIYFAMFNGFGTIAIQTLEDIHHRGCYEMFTDLILVTNAVRNSLHSNPSGQPSDGPMGLSVALTPTTNTVTVSKSMITNASFKTKKLPDDIPIQGITDDSQQTVNTTLTSITEENEQPLSGRSIGSSGSRSNKEKDTSSVSSKAPHKALIAGFKKSKEKDREKDLKNTQSSIINKNNGSSGGGNATNSNLLNADIINGKEISTSASSSNTGIGSSTQKQLLKKADKLLNRNSIQLSSSTDSVDFEKSSSPLLKSKIMSDITGGGSGNSSVSGTTIANSSLEVIQLHNLTNGSELDSNNSNSVTAITTTVAVPEMATTLMTVLTTTSSPSTTTIETTVSAASTITATAAIIAELSDIPNDNNNDGSITIIKRPSLVNAIEDSLHTQISQV